MNLAPMRLALASLIVTLATGCSLLPYEARMKPRLENPRTDIHTMVIRDYEGVPEAGRPIRWVNSLQGQLLDVPGLDRVGVPTSSEDPILEPEAGRAFIEMSVLHFDPYYPPEAIVEVSMELPSARAANSSGVLELDRQGRELGGNTQRPENALRFQLRVDIDDSRIAHDLVRFANAQLDGDRGLDPIDRVTRDSDRFVDFVSYLVLKESFRRLEADESEGRNP